jgi:hypothetical protein
MAKSKFEFVASTIKEKLRIMNIQELKNYHQNTIYLKNLVLAG